MFTHENNSVPELSLDRDSAPPRAQPPTSDGSSSKIPVLDDILTSPAILPSVILKQECSRSQSPEGYALQRSIRKLPPVPSYRVPQFEEAVSKPVGSSHLQHMRQSRHEWEGHWESNNINTNLNDTLDGTTATSTSTPTAQSGENETTGSSPPLTARSSVMHSRIASLIHTPQVIEGWSVTTPSEADTPEAYSSPHFPLDSLTEHLRLYSNSTTTTATMDHVADSHHAVDSSTEHQLELELPSAIQDLLYQPHNASVAQRTFIIALLWQKWPQYRAAPVAGEEVVLFKKGLLEKFASAVGPIGDDVEAEFSALESDEDFLPPDQLDQTDICDPQTMRLKPGYTEEDFDAVPVRFYNLLDEWRLLDTDSPVIKRFYIGDPPCLELYQPEYTLAQLRQKRTLDWEAGDRQARLPSIQLSETEMWRLNQAISDQLDIRGDLRVYSTTEALDGPVDLATFKSMPKVRLQSPYSADKLTPYLIISAKEARGYIEDGSPAGPTMGTTGLNNLGNTCYMNSALQCLVHVPEVVEYFLSGHYESEINKDNPIGKNGDVALAFAELVRRLYLDKSNTYAPRQFKSIVGEYGPQFAGYGQQDSQEFLAYLLDSLHEDLNRILQKPATTKPELDPELAGDPSEVSRVAVESWDVHRLRNDSPILDLFTGMYKSTVVCPVSQQASITFDPFSDLTLPLPVDDSWSKDFIFVPYDTSKRPFIIPVELKKYSRFQELRQQVATKAGENVSPASLMFSEVYMSQFFRHIASDENSPVSDLIPGNDTVVVYETGLSVDEMWSYHHDQQPAKFIVPVFNRLEHTDTEEQPVSSYARRNSQFLSIPFFITVTDAEARDFGVVTNLVYQRYFQTCRAVEDWGALEELPFDINYVTPRTNDIPLGGLSMLNADRIFPMSSRLEVSESSEPDVIEIDASLNSPDKEDVKMEDEDGGEEDDGKVTPEEVADKEDPELPIVTEDPASENVVDISDDEAYKSPVESAGSSVAPSDSTCSERPEATDSAETAVGGPLPPPPPPPFDRHASLPSPPAPTHFVTHTEGIVCDWQGDIASKYLHDYDSLATSAETKVDPELEAARAARADRSHRGIELSECLDLFSAPEVLSDDDLWYCPVCKDFRQATKKIELWKCPEILVIHLKRFSSSRNFRDKISEVVHFPIEGLDLTERVGEAKSSDSPLIYDLIGVDNHMGGLGGGHYTAFAKNFVDGKWYHYNDSSVSPISEDQLVTANAYLLFYKRRTPTASGDSADTKTHGILRDLVSKRAENDLSIYSSFVASAEGKLVGSNSSNTRSSGGSGGGSVSSASSYSSGSSSGAYGSSGSSVAPRLRFRGNMVVSPESPVGNPPAYPGTGSVLGPSPQSSTDAAEPPSSVGGIPWEAASLTLSSSDEEDNMASDLPTPGDSDMHSSVYSEPKVVETEEGVEEKDDEVIIIDDI
ncbi:Ubiquitin carboxyl-terminal hydrolase 12 [Yarrowia sp. C11]|nr:Ubiquitin carboxyl-terminal hydrolase 12 [Yarrowia sp. E02]KAG5372738.1 Ubiquitin carboxyl-terminal hydrolase 12 [Yarrowia sp. C11]